MALAELRNFLLRPVQETQEMWIQSLGRENPLEKGVATQAWSATVHKVAKESDTLK